MVTTVEIAITFLCGVGLYLSLFMLVKTVRASRGELTGPSVVETPRARLYGVPNSFLGILYYSAMAVAVWFVRSPAGIALVLAAAALAAITSVVLGYSLLYVTRRSCPYCWTAHAINWSLVIAVATLFKTNILAH